MIFLSLCASSLTSFMMLIYPCRWAKSQFTTLKHVTPTIRGSKGVISPGLWGWDPTFDIGSSKYDMNGMTTLMSALRLTSTLCTHRLTMPTPVRWHRSYLYKKLWNDSVPLCSPFLTAPTIMDAPIRMLLWLPTGQISIRSLNWLILRNFVRQKLLQVHVLSGLVASQFWRTNSSLYDMGMHSVWL